MADISAAVASLSPEHADLFLKLAQNVLTTPGDVKFRRLKLSNPRIGQLCAVPAARQSFEALGFHLTADGEFLELPTAADLAPLEALIKASSEGERTLVTVMRGPLRTRLELQPRARVAHLAAAIEQSPELGRMPRGRQRLLAGYPPKPLSEGPATLAELGIKTVMLEDEWEQLVSDMRECRVSFVRLAAALYNPSLRTLALVDQRTFVHEQAVRMLKTRIVEVALDELQAARRCFEAVWPPSDPATLAERLELCAVAAKSSLRRREQDPGQAVPDLLGQNPLLEAMGMEVDDEPETHFVLEVQRTELFRTAVRHLDEATPVELRNLLQVRFIDEAAEDAGGLRREFFNEFGRACGAAGDFWRLTPAGSLAPVPATTAGGDATSPSSRRVAVYRSCGRAFGLSLSQSSRPPKQPLLLGLPLARFFVRAVQGHFPESLAELQAELNAEQHSNAPDFRGSERFLGCSLQQLGLEGQLTFGYDIPGTAHVVDLVPGGRGMTVTDATKEQWLAAVLRFELVDSIKEAAEAFRGGVCDVVGASHLVLLTATELREAWSGRGSVSDQDLVTWRQRTEVSPAITQQAQWLFELLQGELREARPRVLKFATGSDRWPTDTRGFRFVVEPRDAATRRCPPPSLVGICCNFLATLAGKLYETA